MKNNENPENENRLSKVLQEWKVDAPLPPRFQEQVWNRIARAEAKAKGSFWQELVRLVKATFDRPKVAYSYAAVLLAFGIAAGSWTAQVKSSRLETDLGQRYLQSINPYQQEMASR
jgi:hypothetical protein